MIPRSNCSKSLIVLNINVRSNGRSAGLGVTGMESLQDMCEYQCDEESDDNRICPCPSGLNINTRHGWYGTPMPRRVPCSCHRVEHPHGSFRGDARVGASCDRRLFVVRLRCRWTDGIVCISSNHWKAEKESVCESVRDRGGDSTITHSANTLPALILQSPTVATDLLSE